MAGALQKSTEVMKAMQSLVKIPEIQATMRELSKEMMKVLTQTLPQRNVLWAHVPRLTWSTRTTQAGIIEEMMEDTLGGMEDEEEMEEEAEAEVDRILFEVTAGKEPHDYHHHDQWPFYLASLFLLWKMLQHKTFSHF